MRSHQPDLVPTYFLGLVEVSGANTDGASAEELGFMPNRSELTCVRHFI